MKIFKKIGFLIFFNEFLLNFLTLYQKPQFCPIQKFKAKRIQSLLTEFCNRIQSIANQINAPTN
jgi:hypothetical protein